VKQFRRTPKHLSISFLTSSWRFVYSASYTDDGTPIGDVNIVHGRYVPSTRKEGTFLLSLMYCSKSGHQNHVSDMYVTNQ
jgi:hypothetical protein